MTCRKPVVLCLALLLASSSIFPASFLVPSDRDLTKRADAIVIGVVNDSRSEIDTDGRVITVSSLAVTEVIKGDDVPVTIPITELGGRVGHITVAVSGSPTYTPGERVLVFLEKHGDRFRTWGMALGKFEFVSDINGDEILTRGLRDEEIFGWNEKDWSPFIERSRSAEKFLDFVRASAKDLEVTIDYYSSANLPAEKIQPSSHVAASSYTKGSESFERDATRWREFDTGSTETFNASGAPPPSQAEVNAVQKAMASWRNDPNSTILIAYGTITTDPIDADMIPGSDGKNTIVFNSTRNVGGGIVGFTFRQYTDTPTNSKNGSTFFSLLEADVSIIAGLSGTSLNSVVAHEAGHAIGLRHSNRPNAGDPSSSTALMNSSPPSSADGNLQDWDKEGANHVYGDATLCFIPTITGQPQDRTIVAGNSTTLNVSAAGIGPINYQWYRGTSGDQSNPVGMNSPSHNTGSLTTTTSFWVRVSNACGLVNSNTATVTVTPCTPPTITAQPKDTSVVSGQSAQLSVQASGTTPLSYEWYRGAKNDTTSGVLGTAKTFDTGPLSTNTSFWVKVRNACGQVASETATVTVTASCVVPSITAQPQSATIQPGQSVMLSVTAEGTSLIYEWYRGTAPDISSGFLGTEPSFDTGPLSANASFWVLIRNACGRVDSNTAVITVQAACPLPQIAPQLSTPSPSVRVDTAVPVNWSTTETVDSFLIEIATDAGFSTIAHSFRARGTARSATLVFPEARTYHLRLFAENACGRTEASSRLIFNVTPAPPRVAVTANPAGMLQTPGQSSTDNYTLTNLGGTSTTIQLGQRGSFFTQNPATFMLQPGASQVVTSNAASQPVGNYEGASIPSGAGVPVGLEIPVKLLVADRPAGNPEVRASTNRVDVAGAQGELVTGSIQFTNTGNDRARGVLVSDVPWIIPQQAFVDMAPGETVTFTFTINRNLRAASQGSEIGTLSVVYLQGASGKIAPAGSTPPPGSKATVVSVSDTVKPVVTTSGIPALEADEVAYFVPGVGHLQGLVGLFVSDVSILNSGTIQNLKDLKVFFTATGISAESSKQTSFSELPANKNLNLTDVAKSVFNSEQQLGNLQIRASKLAPIAINANIFNISNAAGTYGTTIPIFRSDRAAAADEKLYLTGLRKDPTGYTHVYVQETGGEFGSARIDFLGPAGNVLGSQPVNLAPYQLAQILNPLPQGAVTAVVTNTSSSNAKVLAHATPVDQLSGDTWSIADWSRQFGYDVAEPVVIPVGGKLRGANNSDFRTDVTIMNTSSAAASGTLRYYPTGGVPLDRQLGFAPMESRILADVIGTLFGIETSVGYLIFTPTNGTFAVSSRTYTLVQGQGSTFGTGVPTLSLSSSLKQGEVRKIAGIQDASSSTSTSSKPGTYRTNFGLVETAGEAVMVRATMRYTAVQGAAAAAGVSSADFMLQPRQLLLVPSITGAIMGANRALFGELRDIQVDFEVVGGDGNALIFTTSTDNGTNDTALRVE